MPINSFEFLILIIYIWILWYVYQSVVAELDQLTAIQPNQAQLNAQLEKLNLQGKLTIQCAFSKSPLSEEMRTFMLTIANRQEEGNYIYLDWHRSTFRNFKGEVKRLLRLPKGRNLDLFQAQSPSILAPGESIVEAVTIEDVIVFNQESGFVIVHPILTLKEMKAARDKGQQFVVNLFLYQPARPELNQPERYYTIACPFAVKKLPWQNAVYWKPKRQAFREPKKKK